MAKRTPVGPKGRKKVAKVMKEFHSGTLRSSSGDKVTNPKQAAAIGYSEARRMKHKGKKYAGGGMAKKKGYAGGGMAKKKYMGGGMVKKSADGVAKKGRTKGKKFQAGGMAMGGGGMMPTGGGMPMARPGGMSAGYPRAADGIARTGLTRGRYV